MANSKYELEILGDNSSFNKTVAASMRQLDELSEKTNGFFEDISGGASKATNALNMLTEMTPSMMALGAAGLAVGVAFKAFEASNDYVKDLNQISTNTGLTIEMLQKLKAEFNATGISIEKFGDFNKDALDHIGDSIRQGGKGGVADDITQWGINFKDFSKYVGDSQGGIKAVIDLFYKLKAAGASSAEIKNAMESMASDSSHLMTTLADYSSTTEALNAIQSQHAGITSDMAKQYQEFDKNVDTLKANLVEMSVKGITPLIEQMNDLYTVFNKKWTNADFTNMLKQFWYGGDNAIAVLNRRIDGVQDADYSPTIKSNFANISNNAAQLAADQKQNTDIANQAAAAAKKVQEQQDKAAKAKADKAKAAADAAAAKAKAANEKLIADRTAAVQKLNALNDSLYSGEGAQVAAASKQLQANFVTLDGLLAKGYISQQQYVAKRAALAAASQTSFKTMLLGASPEQLGQMLDALPQLYQTQLDDIKTRRDKGLIDAKTYNQQLEEAEQDHQTKMTTLKSVNSNLVNANMNTSMGFASDQDTMQIQQSQLDQQKTQFDAANLAMYNSGIISHQAFLDEKAKLDTAYSLKSQSIADTEIKTKIGMYQSFASGMAGIISGIAGQNSKAAQAAFAVSKGLAVAQGLINAHEASTKAMAMYPGPIGYAMAAASYASAIGNVMQMKSISGQFHDGIDDVPNTGTYLLEGGERVVDKRLNQDLKDFLGDKKSAKADTQSIDASIHIAGSVMDGDKQILSALKKQSQAVASIVQDANRRRM